jgi:hypothetical protein
MSRRESYKDYVIEISEAANNCWKAKITRKDGRLIQVKHGSPGEEQLAVANNPRHSEEEALAEAKRMIDAGGMDAGSRPMFEAYQSTRKPQYRLIIQKGSSLPREAEGGEWVLCKTIDNLDSKARGEVEANGYYLYRMDGIFEEKVGTFRG